MLLVSHDAYLSLALTQHIFRRTQIHLCASLEEAERFFEQKPLPRIVIDLDCIPVSAIHVLNTLRAWQKTRPTLAVDLLNADRNAAASCLIVAAANCRVIERRLDTEILSWLLMKPPCSLPPVRANYSRVANGFSAREWQMLLAVAEGHTLKNIAASLNKPYHVVVYTLGRISRDMGLSGRRALIHLLHELSIARMERKSSSNRQSYE